MGECMGYGWEAIIIAFQISRYDMHPRGESSRATMAGPKGDMTSLSFGRWFGGK